MVKKIIVIAGLVLGTSYLLRAENMLKNPGGETIDSKSKNPVSWSLLGLQGVVAYESETASSKDWDKREIVWGIPLKPMVEWGSSTEEFNSGKRSVYFKVTGFAPNKYVCGGIVADGSEGINSDKAFLVKPGETYHYSFYLKGRGFTRPIRVCAWFWNKKGVQGNTILSVIPQNVWSKNRGSFVVPPGSERMALGFVFYDKNDTDNVYGATPYVVEGATFYIDDVYLSTKQEKVGKLKDF